MTLMNPRHTTHFCTISTELAPEQINAILGKVTFIEPAGLYRSYLRMYYYEYEQDVLFYGHLGPNRFALRRLSSYPSPGLDRNRTSPAKMCYSGRNLSPRSPPCEGWRPDR